MRLSPRNLLHSGLLPGAVLLLGACTAPSPKVWNLRQVHYPDGRAKYVGDVRWEIEHLLVMAFDSTALGTPDFIGGEQDAIKDPFKVCLKNLNELAKCNRDNPKTRARMVEMYTWLAGDCTYSLSRERCAVELGELGTRTGLKAPRVLGPDATPATALEVGELVPLLFNEATPLVGGQDTPELRKQLADRCRTIEALTLDRDGARRLLRVTNILLSRWRVQRRESVEPLLRLHLDLEKQCIALALGDLLGDENPRVRAAAIRSAIDVTGNSSPQLLARAFQDPSVEVVVAAIRSLAENGVPRPSRKGDPDLYFRTERFWIEQVIELLRLGTGGQLAVAGCQAMSRLTGEPPDLHPEVWIVWWEDRGNPDMGGPGSRQGAG